MAKRKGTRKQGSELATPAPELEQTLKSLIRERKYPQAIRKLQQALKQNPDQQLSISEVDIRVQQGQDELQRGRYAKAESTLSQAFAQVQNEDTYYWLAKCFLNQQKLTEALELFQSAFENKLLPKNLGGGYLKLLFLVDRADQVETLIHQQTKRFYAPHLHWARGVLALKADDLETALTHFKKMGRPASPGDRESSWQAYAHQRLGQWPKAEAHLGMMNYSWGNRTFRPPQETHPAMQRLVLNQVANTGQSAGDFVDLRQPELPNAPTAWVLEWLSLVKDDNIHDSAHVLLDMPPTVMAAYPELEELYFPVMLLAGEQAQREQDLDCTALFWGKVIDQQTFDPKLAVQLYLVLDQVGERRGAQKLVDRLLRWVQKEAKQNPSAWPESRQQSVLAKLHCWMADNQMSMGQRREANRSVQAAEKLSPEHPEVIGRKGLAAALEKDSETAIAQLTQALEAGCQYSEVYIALVQELEADPEAKRAIRLKYGKHFGDTAVETEVVMPTWIEALALQDYTLMKHFITEQTQPTAPVKTLQIFLEAAEDESSSSQKVTLNQAIAVPQWDQLLASVSAEEKVDCLTAIYIAVQTHARRNKKGIAALLSRYSQDISALIPEEPKAALAHLMLLPLKKLSDERLRIAVGAVLSRTPQPGDLLATAQLQLRRFSTETGFRPFIEQQLQQEPQNPRLLLAKATLSSSKSPAYQMLYQQGFEIARRLQDAAALQAYREEDWTITKQTTGRVVGDKLRNPQDPGLDMLDILRRMAQEAFGVDVPPEILAQMLPELEAQMEAEMEDGDEDDEPFFFLPLPPKPSKKKRKSFFDL